MASRNVSEKDIKILYGRSAGCCNNCSISVFVPYQNGNGYSHIGEMAHNIPYGSGENAPRVEYKVIDDNNPDNSYSNLILLCRNCHKVVDSDVNYYTPERLCLIKNHHEHFIETQVCQIGEVAKDANTVKIMHEFCNFQSIYHELSNYIRWDRIPIDVTDIGDIYEFFLKVNTPSLYPFYDHKLNMIFDNILSSCECIFNMTSTKYEIRNSYLVPMSSLHELSEKDQYILEGSLKSLAKHCGEWLSYCREKRLL